MRVCAKNIGLIKQYNNKGNNKVEIYLWMLVYVYVYPYVCVCVCICVFMGVYLYMCRGRCVKERTLVYEQMQ